MTLAGKRRRKILQEHATLPVQILRLLADRSSSGRPSTLIFMFVVCCSGVFALVPSTGFSRNQFRFPLHYRLSILPKPHCSATSQYPVLQYSTNSKRLSACLFALFGSGIDEDEDEADYDPEQIDKKRQIQFQENELQRKIDEQQKQIDLLLSMMGQQQIKNLGEKEPSGQDAPIEKQESLSASTSVSPLKAMLFIDGTWLYYSIHTRNRLSCPIIQKYGRGWQRKYYFDFTALPRIICKALQEQDNGWAVQTRPVEIARVSVFSSYYADTSAQSHRFQMYQDMSNANYDVHMMETVGKNEKCVDIQIAVEMLHYATVPNAYDVALLLTGDKDFMPAMIRTRQKGRRVGLVSMRSGCNRVLYEQPVDRNDNNEHNHNIRDYDVVWIEDHLDELIKSKRGTEAQGPDDSSSLTTPFTLMKVVSDFISKSGFDRVNSRDIGYYLNTLKIGSDMLPWSLLDELKCVYGGAYQFFTMSHCFVVTAKDLYTRNVDPTDRSFWVSLRDDADMTLVKAARESKLSQTEKEFFDGYSLDTLNDKEKWYRGTLKFARTKSSHSGKSLKPLPKFEPSRPSHPGSGDANGIVASGEHDFDLPDELTRDYSDLTVPKLKEYCRERGLKVSGTKAQLLERIEEHVDLETAKLKDEYNKYLQSKNDLYNVAPTSIDDNDASVSEKGSYLTELVAEYVRAAGGLASSRNVGRYLAANKASPSRMAVNGNRSGVTALQELKEKHINLVGFIYDNPEHFEKREMDYDEDTNEPAAKYAFYVALVQQPKVIEVSG